MKTVKFDYGKNGIEIRIDPSWNVTIIEPITQEAFLNPIKSLRTAIQNPTGGRSLEAIVREKEKLESICILVSDATRPVPSHLIIKALISELEHLGFESSLITILIATGLHRPSNVEEIQRIVGKSPPLPFRSFHFPSYVLLLVFSKTFQIVKLKLAQHLYDFPTNKHSKAAHY